MYALLLRFYPLYFIHNETVLCIVCVPRYRVISERIPEWFVSRGDSRSECREIKRARMPSPPSRKARMIFTIVLRVPIRRTAELLADTRFSDINSSRHAAALQRISDSLTFCSTVSSVKLEICRDFLDLGFRSINNRCDVYILYHMYSLGRIWNFNSSITETLHPITCKLDKR